MNKGLFEGWAKVFKFTFSQNTKGKSYKFTLFGIGIFLFLLFFAINMLTGYFSDKDKEKKPQKIETVVIENLYYYSDENISPYDYIDSIKDNTVFNNVVEARSSEEVYNQVKSDSKDGKLSMGIAVEYDKEKNLYDLHLNGTSKMSKDKLRDIGEEYKDYYKEKKLITLGEDEENISIIMSEGQIETKDVSEKEKSFAVEMMWVFVPMIVIFVLYMMILIYGQSVGKIIISEKSSKLMETMLVSVKPYGIILGKVLAVYVAAIIQIFVWIFFGVAGYLVGDKIAGTLFDNYNNQILEIVKLVIKSSSDAFSVPALILMAISILLGFMIYMLLAAMLSSMITKAEELSNINSVYQIIVVIGFIASYFISLFGIDSWISKAIDYFPVTSPFILPSDILLGNIGILKGIVCIMILVVCFVILVYETGKIYKKKIF